jgi:ribose transport system substrate-binding protein
MRRFRAGACALAAVSLFAVGCGGNDDSSSSSSGSSGSSSSSSGSSADTGAPATDIAAVKARVAEYEKGPTAYQGPTDKVPVAKRIKLAWVPCSQAVRGCVRPVEEAGKLAKELGWDVKSYDGKGTPKDNNSAVEQAVAGGADVVLTGGVDPSFIAGGLKSAKDKGVLVASLSQYVPPAPDGYKFDIGADYKKLGNMIGDWAVADSDGKAVLLPFRDNSFKSAVAVTEGTEDAVRACKTCQVLGEQLFVATDLGSRLGPRAVDILRKNPDINYVLGTYDPAATALVPAIANAGLKGKVKVIASLGNEQNLNYVKSGNIQEADSGFDNAYMGYMAIYQVNRLLAKQPLWETPGVADPVSKYSGNVPLRLFTTDNPPATTKDYTADDAIHWKAKMRPLFGLSGDGT